jgi:hypothetical protein
MDEDLNEFGNPYPTLSEMNEAWNESYKKTLSYQAEQLEAALHELGRALLELFVPLAWLIIRVIRAFADWIDPSPNEETIIPAQEFIRTFDGEILVIEDAPPVEILGKRKIS